MAQLYTNENFPQPTVEKLRALGHDVLTTHDAGRSGKSVPDLDVLRFAIAQKRIMVTLNRRHFVKLHTEMPEHYGIVVCSADDDFESLAERIHAALDRETDFAGTLIRVNRPPE